MANKLSRNVTYLLGAGASANAIPVVSQMEARLIEMSRIITSIDANNATLKEIREELRWLAKHHKKYYSIDTAAKIFYHKEGRNSESLRRLKKVVSLYFVLEQISIPDFDLSAYDPGEAIKKGIYYEAIDNRYYRLLAYYLGNNHIPKLPENLHFISWNYDFQLELAFHEFGNNTYLRETSEEINSLPRESRHKLNTGDVDRGKVIHLNGVAGLLTSPLDKRYSTQSLVDQLHLSRKDLFSKKLQELNILEKFDCDRTLSFAWEEESMSKDYLAKAAQVMLETDDLVVIGYSFPNFNREVDSILISNFWREGLGTKRIFYQDISDKSQNLEGMFKIKGVQAYTEVGEHFIPPGV
ncbi:MAG: hypothetical protein RLP14_07230 [Owenweeksia sp.]